MAYDKSRAHIHTKTKKLFKIEKKKREASRGVKSRNTQNKQIYSDTKKLRRLLGKPCKYF